MKRISRGAPKKGCPPKGSYGYGFYIEDTKEHWKKSCSACINFCKEDKSCTISNVIPSVDGWDFYKRCENFELNDDFKEHYGIYRKKVEQNCSEQINEYKDSMKRKKQRMLEKNENPFKYTKVDKLHFCVVCGEKLPKRSGNRTRKCLFCGAIYIDENEVKDENQKKYFVVGKKHVHEEIKYVPCCKYSGKKRICTHEMKPMYKCDTEKRGKCPYYKSVLD